MRRERRGDRIVYVTKDGKESARTPSTKAELTCLGFPFPRDKNRGDVKFSTSPFGQSIS
jgi:hypothetical protein